MLYFIPQERIEFELDGAVSIVSNLTVSYTFIFAPRSFDQTIDILISCYEGSVDVIVLTHSEWSDWYNGDDYSALYEALNTTHVSTTVQISPPVVGYVYVMIQTNHGDASLIGSLQGHSMAYDEYTAILLATLTLPFIVGLVTYNITIRRRKEVPTNSTQSELASLE